MSKFEGLLFHGPYIHKIVTFGQPLFANSELATVMRREFFQRYYRVVNGVDIVSTVPFWLSHFGSLVWLRDQSIEFRREAILAGGPGGGGISEADIPPELTPSEDSMREFLEATKSTNAPTTHGKYFRRLDSGRFGLASSHCRSSHDKLRSKNS